MKIKNTSTKEMTLVAMIALLYVILTVAVPAISYGPIQFRISELLNFVVIPKRKYAFGVILGVIIANFFSPFVLDIFFGTLHTALSFLICTLLFNVVHTKRWQYGLVVLIFSSLMFIIAYELAFIDNNFTIFWQLYGTLFMSECVILSIGAPIMYIVEQRLAQLGR